MTDQERQQGFIDEYNVLTQKYGLTFGAQLKPEQLGVVVQVRPELVLTAIEGWKPPEEEPANAKANGKK